MAEILGRQVEVGVSVESVRGTAEVAVQKWVKKANATVVERAAKAIDPSTRGRMEDALGARVTKKWLEGSVDGVLHADAIGYVLHSLYGGVSSAPSGGATAHTFSVDQTVQHPTLTLTVKEGGVVQQSFAGCVAGEAVISATLDDYVRTSASFTGKGAVASTEAPSYGTDSDFVARDITLKFADTEGGLAGATAVKATDVEITISQGVIPYHVIGAYEPSDVFNGEHSIEVKFTRAFSDETFKDLFLGDGYKYAQVSIVGAADIGGGAHPGLVLTLNRVAVTDWTREGGSNELVTEPVTIKAFYNEADGETSTAVLTNNTEAYGAEASA